MEPRHGAVARAPVARSIVGACDNTLDIVDITLRDHEGVLE
jgi:hypothetical protein